MPENEEKNGNADACNEQYRSEKEPKREMLSMGMDQQSVGRVEERGPGTDAATNQADQVKIHWFERAVAWTAIVGLGSSIPMLLISNCDWWPFALLAATTVVLIARDIARDRRRGRR